MAQKKAKTDGYKSFADSLAAGRIGRFYIFHGDERYLLERSLGEIRRRLCPDGLDGFNYKRFEGKYLAPDELGAAVDALPVMADRTLIEVHDFDIFKSEWAPQLFEMFSDLPDYVCVIFVYDTVAYKPDGRVKLNSEIIKLAESVEFTVQGQDKLVKWIKRHFEDAGKHIGSADAEYLAHITGGHMNALHGEIEKTSAFAKGDTVTRSDIDSVVTPNLDTAAYKLADALLRSNYTGAMKILCELLQMHESAHKLMFSVSLKMRQLLAARVCIESNFDKGALMEICGIRYDFQAKALMDTARKTTLARCRGAVMICAATAYALNSGSQPEACMTELIARLAYT